MMDILAELIAILEEEVQVGEDLLRNLAAQKEAILVWDSTALLKQVEEKERLVRQLGALEERRQEAACHLLRAQGLPATEQVPALRELLAQLPPTPRTATLDHLQRRAWQVYSRLRTGEKKLTSLMGILLGHISEALGSLTPPQVSLYGEKGTLATSRPAPGLVQEKI
ncbi:MAG: flagellar export chaperone FlgN [Deltaproteobacteria bacterium]|nr:flagellar export chaperone FlgN [Deltaproteobacteria bacterium]